MPSLERSSRALARSVALLLAMLLSALVLSDAWGPAEAQSTGGSFGGGDWGGGGGGGGGGYSGGGGSSSDHDGGFFLVQLVFMAFRIHPLFGLVVLVIGVGVLVARGAASRGSSSTRGSGSGGWTPPTAQPFVGASAPAAGSRGWMGADVTQVRIALDVSARGAIEQALNSLMQSVDVRSRHGLLLMVHRVAGLLRQNERAWRLAGETNYHPMSPPQASGVFSQLAAAGRARAAGAVGHSTDPNGVFFITLLVAAKREIVDFQAHRPEQVRMVLDDLIRLTESDLVAAECYWLPLAQGTGMSMDEVRRLHPDMKHVEHATGGAATAVTASSPAPFCPFCGKQRLRGGPTCEHCGAG